MNKRFVLRFTVIFVAVVSGILLGLNRSGTSIMRNNRISNFFIRDKKPKLNETEEPNTLETRIPETKKATTVFDGKEILNILLLGIDRRSKSATTYNTDTMILLSANPKSNTVLLTSVPRDLWINGNKLNALYSVQGEDVLLNAFEKITGLEVDGYIRCDFEDFRWIVESFGEVPVDIERTFTDISFPNNSDTGAISVTFEEGSEKMDGDRALTFARSRKGDNGEGSDLMRAKRQHLILMGMIDAISQPESIFWPMNLPKFYETVTQHMYTTLNLGDITYLWDFYKDRDKYEITSFVVDDRYIYHPGMYPQSDYKAWVFIPRDESFGTLHSDIHKMLYPSSLSEPTKETSN